MPIRQTVAPALLVVLLLAAPVAVAQDLSSLQTYAPYSGSTAAVGQSFTARIRIIWQSPITTLTTDFVINFYYCPTATPTGCVLLGTTPVTQNFSPGMYLYVNSPNLTVPASAVMGTGYIRFFIDAGGAVNEINENNNNAYDQISVTTPPDLSFAGAQVPYTGSADGPGASFTARHTIQAAANQSAVVTDFVLAYSFCPSPGPTGCTPLGETTVSTDLSSGASTQVQSGTLAIPASATPGIHYLRAVVDSTSVVSEGNESNNSYYTGITVLGPPDLAVDQVVAPLSGSTAGAGSTFTARCRVRNLSGATMATNVVLQAFYCPSASTTGCASLGTSTMSVDLSAGQSTLATSSTLTLPTSAKLGSGQIRFLIDATDLVLETNEANNDGYGPITVTTLPDLSFQNAVVPLSGSVASAGALFTARYQIRNAPSTSAFDTNFAVAVSYCPGNGPTGCIALGQSTMSTDYLSGQTNPLTTAQLAIPVTATPGARFIRAVLDSGGVVNESNESNNERYDPITVGSAAPDLQVKSFTATVSGSSVSYSAEICNGGAATTKSFTIALTFDAASAPTCGGSPDQLWTVTTGLAAGACEIQNHTRPNVLPGSYTAWFFADAACALPEPSESNNIASAGYLITPPPDAGTQDLGTPADAKPVGDGPRDASASGEARDGAATSDAAWRWPELGGGRDGGTSWPALDPGPAPADPGCGCALGSGAGSDLPLLVLGAVLVALALARARRRR